jgi:hypothetical protein
MLVFLILSEYNGREDIFTGDVKLNACRYLCSVLLHISIMPEFTASFDMMRYAVNNQEIFKDQKLSFFPFVISLMKCTAAIVTEIVNIYVLGTCKSSQVVSYSYITFGIIARLDDLICMTVDED